MRTPETGSDSGKQRSRKEGERMNRSKSRKIIAVFVMLAVLTAGTTAAFAYFTDQEDDLSPEYGIFRYNSAYLGIRKLCYCGSR